MIGKSSDRLCSNHSLLIFIALASSCFLFSFYSRSHNDLSRNFQPTRLPLVRIIDGGLKFRRHREHFFMNIGTLLERCSAPRGGKIALLYSKSLSHLIARWKLLCFIYYLFSLSLSLFLSLSLSLSLSFSFFSFFLEKSYSDVWSVILKMCTRIMGRRGIYIINSKKISFFYDSHIISLKEIQSDSEGEKSESRLENNYTSRLY